MTTVASGTQLSTKGRGFWIGLNNINKENGFQWTDGTATSFFNWNNGEPNNFNGIEDCVEIYSNGAWNDNFCYINNGWMCRINKGVIPPTNPIIVPDSFQGKIKSKFQISNLINFNLTLYF